MTEKIYHLLNLTPTAGLGRRVAASEVNQDAENPNLFYILSRDNVVEALALAEALSVQVEKLHLRNVHFKPVRTLACH